MTFKSNLVQPPCNEQGHLQLDQVVQNPVQPDLECFQGWGIHNISGPVPVFHHPHCKKFLPYIYSESTLFLSKTIIPCPIATGSTKSILGKVMEQILPVTISKHKKDKCDCE